MTSRYILLEDGSLRCGRATFRPWPDFRAHGFDPELAGLLREILLSADLVPLIWSATVPPSVRAALLRLPAESMPGLLEAAQRGPVRIVDWCAWCPALAVLLCAEDVDGRGEPPPCDCLRRGGWRDLLRARGWPVSAEVLRLLCKIPAEAASPGVLQAVRTALGDSRKRRLLRHISRIDGLTADTLGLDASLLNTALLDIRAEDLLGFAGGSIHELVRAVAGLRAQLGLPPVDARSGLFRNAHSLQMHLWRLSIAAESGTARRGPFPPPPFPGADTAGLHTEPLTTARAMADESRRMVNCVYSYVPLVRTGTYYAYRVLRPVRATLIIARHGTTWLIDQVRARSNRDVPPALIDDLEHWLDIDAPAPPIPDDDPADYPF